MSKKRRRRHELRTLAALRIKLGMSQEELASAIGLWQPDISMFETGSLIIPADRADQILAVFARHPHSSVLPDGITSQDLSRPWDEVLIRLSGTSERVVEESR